MADMRASIARLKHGQVVQFEGPAGTHAVSYHEMQSHGDDGRAVRGATTGSFQVLNPDGQFKDYNHGPHATTMTAARRGANPNAKGLTADRVASDIAASHHRAQARSMGGVFNDRRA